MSAPRIISTTRNLVALTFLALGLGACFTDAPTVECSVGEELCGCNKNGACFEGLTCHQGEVCISEDCELGAMNCPCENGLCSAGLECTDRTCRPRESDTDTTPETDSTTVITTSGPSSTSTTATVSTSEPSTSSTTVSTTDPTITTTSAETDTSTTGPSDSSDEGSTSGVSSCEPQEDCPDCIGCVEVAGEPCAMLKNECENLGTCSEIADCFLNRAVGLTLDDCCEGHPLSEVEVAYDLRECWFSGCTECDESAPMCQP